MKFTFNWLKEFVTIKVSPEKLANLLTMAGLEVESLAPLRGPDKGQQDWLFEISVTPNRGDCLGLKGLAREVAALTGGRVKSPAISAHAKDASMAARIKIAIQNSRLCPRYSARIVENVRVGAAPSWLRFRLESCGIRSINNVVDVTNYVMLETGQPLHAFDLDRLATGRIIIRQANDVKRFTTLDGVERELVPEDLVICDGDTPIALAGVMGGMESEVHSGTQRLLLESAHFDPLSVRRTAKRLVLHSEASHRFERGVDPEGTLHALDRSVYLLQEIAGGTPVKGALDRYPRRIRVPTILLREERIEELLGVRIEGKKIEKFLHSLGAKTRRSSRGVIKVIPPSSRPDLTREADLIEELARLYGYQKIPTTLPLLRPGGGKTDHRLRRERMIRSFLVGEGLVEVINLPFTSARLNQLFSGLWGSVSPVRVLNPLAKESDEMRLSLVPGLIESLRVNLAQQAKGFCGFHLGKVFRLAPNGDPEERQCLSGLLYGSRRRIGLHAHEPSLLTFLDCKGLVEGILDVMQVSRRVGWSNNDVTAALHPGRAAVIISEEKKLGYLGEIHPNVREELDLPLFLLFELDFEELVEYAPREKTARFLPRFPAVERDLAVVVDEGFPSQQIIEWVRKLNNSLIENVEVFDEYRGAPIPDGKKSLAYKISYRSEDRTLTDSEVKALHEQIVGEIGEIFGAQLRG
ncbi:MAG TPA: phenylalanine--tRNA ligase subunit beta [Candidatus Binatia bacterium]|nr:phenylalanine--tRNA ligase subunit beta [Candidatus Binatia bacterium]